MNVPAMAAFAASRNVRAGGSGGRSPKPPDNSDGVFAIAVLGILLLGFVVLVATSSVRISQQSTQPQRVTIDRIPSGRHRVDGVIHRLNQALERHPDATIDFYKHYIDIEIPSNQEVTND